MYIYIYTHARARGRSCMYMCVTFGCVTGNLITRDEKALWHCHSGFMNKYLLALKKIRFTSESREKIPRTNSRRRNKTCVLAPSTAVYKFLLVCLRIFRPPAPRLISAPLHIAGPIKSVLRAERSIKKCR